MHDTRRNVNVPAGRRGFTLVELLVAVSVTVLMLFFVNRVFFDTTEAISRGIGMSDVIGNVRGIGDQIQRDGEQMVGPRLDTGVSHDQSGGVLIITQFRISDVVYPLPGTVLRDGRRSLRSDQLVFITQRSADGYNISPGSTSSHAPPADANRAEYARVWYGHLNRTRSSGADANGNLLIDAPTQANALGQPGADAVATRLLLGRQALFLGESGSPPPPANLSWISAQGGWYDAPIIGYGSGEGLPTWGGGYTNSRPPLYMGLTDYAYCSLYDLNGTLNPSIASQQHPYGAIVGGDSTSHAAANNPSRRLWSDLPAEDYRRRAIENYTFSRKRLRVNPVPSTGNVYSWEIAQMHGLMAEGVSDFIVEWAGDTTGNNQVDTISAAESSAADGFGVDLPEGSIKWYTHSDFRNDPLNPTADGFDPSQPATFAPPSSYDPYENTASYFTNNAPNARAGFVWRHDRHDATAASSDPNYCDWPYLIRVRYRMHDKRGQLRSGEDPYGVWFEHIIRVRRP